MSRVRPAPAVATLIKCIYTNSNKDGVVIDVAIRYVCHISRDLQLRADFMCVVCIHVSDGKIVSFLSLKRRNGQTVEYM